MKVLRLVGVVVAVLFTILSTPSCNDVLLECENGGVNVDGNCQCPEGYFGRNCESLDTSDPQASLDAGIAPLELYKAGVPIDQLYGKIYEGGLICYLNVTTGSGLLAATEDQTFIEDQTFGAVWGCVGLEINGADGEEVGDGAQNTMDILANCAEDGIAAKLCDDLVLNGKSDWFLPSKGEVTLMYLNLDVKGHGEFRDWYMSSTEFSPELVWTRSFSAGSLAGGHKGGYGLNTRAMRAF